MEMKKTTRSAALAAICVAVALPSLAVTQTVTNTVNGIKWQLLIDTSANTVSVGPIWGNPAEATGWKNNSYAMCRTLIDRSVSGVQGTIEVPGKFKIDGVEYTTTVIGNRSFYASSNLSTLVLPLYASTTKIGTCAFWTCGKLANFVMKGPATVAPGETQNYNTLTLGYSSYFGECKAVQRVLVGPNIKLNNATSRSNFQITGSTNTVCLLPSTSANTTWVGVDLKGVDQTVLYYGLSDDRKAITFSTADADELAAFLDFAPLVKEYLGLDTRLSITNTVTMTEEQTATLSAFGFDSLAHVKFEAKDATQYANAIAAVPGAATLIADSAKLRGAVLTVPAERKVIVPILNGGKYSPNGNGKLTLPRETKYGKWTRQ